MDVECEIGYFYVRPPPPTVELHGSHRALLWLGPEPALQAEQLVRSLLTTFGASHDTQSAPNPE